MTDFINEWLNFPLTDMFGYGDPYTLALNYVVPLLVPVLMAAGSFRVLSFLFWRGTKGGN